MTWQRSGGFAKGLKSAGVRNIIVGDLTEEWYLYAIAHPISLPGDIRPNLERYYQQDLVEKMLKMYEDLPPGCTAEQAERRFGVILSDGQVHLPVRLLARDLYASGFPVLRYEIRWTPEQGRPKGECSTHLRSLPCITFQQGMSHTLPTESSGLSVCHHFYQTK